MWEYAEASRVLTFNSVRSPDCIFCRKALVRLPAQRFEKGEKTLLVQFSLCPCCGWWTVYRVHQGTVPRAKEAEGYSGSIGCLRDLDLTDTSLPLAELRKYLAAKPDKVFEVAPAVLEDIVGSIYRDFGYGVRVTGQRVPGEEGDDGIDVILERGGKSIGVQVRRYKKSLRIEAEAIRSLAGALMLAGHTRGIFVTTSSFRSGAFKAAEKAAGRGYTIELVDAPRFFDALGIAQMKSLDITNERITSYVIRPGIHIGSGIRKEFVEGEDLLERTIAIMTLLPNEDLVGAEEELGE